MGRRVLVCGGRDYANFVQMRAVLDAAHAEAPFSLVIHGDANGADRLSGDWARLRGIPLAIYPANWSGNGMKAGPIRNQRMLALGKPEIVFAFPGGSGTADMIRRSEKAGVPVVRV